MITINKSITYNMKIEKIHKLVYEYPTKHKEGLTSREVDELLTKYFPTLNRKKYSKNLGIHTAMVTPEDGTVTYHNNVFYGIVNTLAGKDLGFDVD